MSEFPKLPRAALGRDDVVNYLIEQRQRGYEVFQDERPHILILKLNDAHRIKFVITNSCQVQAEQFGQTWSVADVSTTAELRNAVNGIAQRAIGSAWANTPTHARVSEQTRATNLATISNLIGAASIEAIFDPYLDNRSLASLLDILSFGNGTVRNGVRVLSTPKTTVGQVPRLTRVGFDAWLQQLNISGDIRIMGPSEHRRFMLLSGGQSLILGQSLNSIHKNEAVRLEADTQDRAFFDRVWAQAAPLT